MPEKKAKKTKPAKKKEPVFSFQSKNIPTSPGCYLFWDKDDRILYVGKAKHLRKRVASYFQKTKKARKTEVLVKKIARIETRTVSSEMESLILENNLIKEFRPRFNIRLKDDKNFVYLRITNEPFPKMEITRRLVRDGSYYIGPKTSAKEFRETVRFCQKFFKVRMVKSSLDYYPLVVTGALDLSQAEYRKNVDMMKQFLSGKTDGVLKVLKEKMMRFAGEQNFEAAAKTRDLISSIEKSTRRQTVQFTDHINRDFIHFVREGSSVYFVRIAFRHGKLLDQNEVEFRAEEFFSDGEVVEAFLKQFYEKVHEIPREIYVPVELEERGAVEQWLSEELFGGNKLEILKPQRGAKKNVIKIALKNATHFAERKKVEDLSRAENFANALPELAEALGLKEPPRRIECFDISHLSGTATVASQVVFVDGIPKKSEYRRFRVRQLAPGKIDDFAAMTEILGRRFARTFTAEKKVELTMKAVETETEWARYHEIRKTEIFDRYHPDIEYKTDHPDEKKKKHHPMIFVHGDRIIGTVRLDEMPQKKVVLRLFAIDTKHQKKGFGTQALKRIEAWCSEHKKKELLVNAAKEAVDFYRKAAFVDGIWSGEEESTLGPSIALGKVVTPQKEKWPVPDLIVIDGGKGQLSSVMKAVAEFRFQGSASSFDPTKQIIALAKRDEQIFRSGKKEPLELPYESAALKLLQRLRDEAHRFAISYNRSVREKTATTSILDEVPGIGSATRKKLIKTFGSVAGVKSAKDAELLKILSRKQLDNLRKHV